MDTHLIKILKRQINSTPLKKSYNFTYKTQKYNIETIIKYILIVLKKSLTWRDLSIFYNNICWNTIYKHFIKLSKYNIFRSSYSSLLTKYFRKTPTKKLKCVYTDTTVIYNKNGLDNIGRNKYHKNKKVTKISVITDDKRIPIMANIYSGNIYDSKILFDQLENNKFIINDNLIKKNKYIIGDKGYDSNKLREILNTKYNSTLIAPQNKRNIKNPALLRTLSIEQEKNV